MENDDLYPKLDHCKKLGKGVLERKSKIEKELLSLQKRILDLQRQRRLAYRNSVKVKKTIHNQINQIVKCLRARERYLLSKVDEAYMCENTSYDTQLSVLQSREIRCNELYRNLENFKDKRDAVKKINNILDEVSHFEKQTFKPLQFTSNFELVTETAKFYGCIEGEFVEMDLPIEDCCQSPNSDNSFFIMDKDLHLNSSNEVVKVKSTRRERTESQDSFEIIDLLGNMNCEDSVKNDCEFETDISTSANHSPKYEELCNVADCLEEPSILAQTQTVLSDENKLKENAKEKMHDVTFQGLPSKHCFLRANEEKIRDHTQQILKGCMQNNNNGIYNRYSLTSDTKSWLQNSRNCSSSIPVKKADGNSESINSKMNVAWSQIDTVKHAFAPFLTKDRLEDWLAN